MFCEEFLTICQIHSTTRICKKYCELIGPNSQLETIQTFHQSDVKTKRRKDKKRQKRKSLILRSPGGQFRTLAMFLEAPLINDCNVRTLAATGSKANLAGTHWMQVA